VLYPALEVRGVDGDLALAVVDEHGPTAVEERDGLVRIFFADRASRHDAGQTLLRDLPLAAVVGVDVDDEDWARRSQRALQPVSVGAITVVPDCSAPLHPTGITIVIAPSTGFGTGHHATTRLCLDALQSLDLAGKSVLDVGTGSGILAIAARRLGARQVYGIDRDPDAVRAAEANVRLNAVDGVRFDIAELAHTALPHADVVTANLTAASLLRFAPVLLAPLESRGGSLVVGGILRVERDQVIGAFAPLRPEWEGEEDGWVGIRFLAPPVNFGARFEV
jgi:ribosomal protein L11 methyltransferase